MKQEEILLKGDSGNFLQIAFEEVYGFPATTSWLGGYEVRSTLSIKSAAFQVNSNLFVYTKELFTFYQELGACNQLLSGKATYSSFEDKLAFTVEYGTMGHVIIRGQFAENMPHANLLDFEFPSDQSFMQASLQQLKAITTKYSDAHGVK